MDDESEQSENGKGFEEGDGGTDTGTGELEVWCFVILEDRIAISA